MSAPDRIEIDTARIRALQGIYPDEHSALTHWGNWAADRRGILPRMHGCSVWEQANDSGEGFGEKSEEELREKEVTDGREAQQERVHRGYDQKLALILDERIHSPGGLGVEVRIALRVAYVSREIPEYQFPRAAGCGIDGFCERLETALKFTRRFI